MTILRDNLRTAVLGLLFFIAAFGPGISAGWAEELHRAFELRPGESDAAQFDLHAPGVVEATATWERGPKVLTLTIRGIGHDVPIASRTGPSPLRAEVTVDEAMIRDSVTWRAQVDGPVQGKLMGELRVRYPSARPRPGTVKLQSGSVLLNPETTASFLDQVMNADSWRVPAYVRLVRPPTMKEREELAQRGIEVLHAVGDNTYHSAISRRVGVEDELPTVPKGLIHSICGLKPEQKIEKQIDLGQFSRFTLPKRGRQEGEAPSYVKNPDGTVNLTVSFLKGTPRVEMESVLSRFTQQLTKRTDESWVVTIPPEAIRPLARQPLVTWIEAAPMPHIPENDNTRSAIHADAVQSVRLSHRPPIYRLDGAGDLDLLFGNSAGDVLRSINDGSDTKPSFLTPVPMVMASGSAIHVCGRAAPVLGDRNGDGVLDLYIGSGDGTVTLFVNSGTDADPMYKAGVPVQAGETALDAGTNAAPCLWDADDDGDRDLVVGNADGFLLLYNNVGDDAAPQYVAPVRVKAAGTEIDVGDDACPALEDIDNDGDLDLVVGNADGRVVLFRNDGTIAAYAFAAGSPLSTGGVPIDVGRNAAPAFFDLNGDRLADLAVGNSDGAILIFRNASTNPPSFTPVCPPRLLPTTVAGGFAVPLLRDLDLDGVRVANGEKGLPDSRHQDFEGRVALRGFSSTADHATHVTGTMAGSGARSDQTDRMRVPNGGTPFQWRGMAPGAGIVFLDNIGYSDKHSSRTNKYFNVININQANIINGSYPVSHSGEYNGDNQLGDQVVRGDAMHDGAAIAPTTLVFSAGNSGNDGYFTLTKQFKNAIIVGNWDATENPPRIRYQSGWTGSSLGPTTDGRVKPDLVAPGTDIMSDVSSRLDGYRLDTGTSMASAAIAGSVALMLDAWSREYGVPLSRYAPLPSTLRALLIHTATDIDWVNHAPAGVSNTTFKNPDGPIAYFPGPDFVSGWGLVNVSAAVDAIHQKQIHEDAFDGTSPVKEYEFPVAPGGTPVKVTLAWDDPASDSNNDPTSKSLLLNDLDLELQAPDGTISYPFAPNQKIVHKEHTDRELAPEEQTPDNIMVQTLIQPLFGTANVVHPIKDLRLGPAPRGRDHLNNVEQVLSQGPPGTWKARVRAFHLKTSPQRFSVIGPWGPDTTRPTIAGPTAIRLRAPSHQGVPSAVLTPATVGVASTDTRDPAPDVTLDAPTNLPVGRSSVVFKATDSAGNTVLHPVHVTVMAPEPAAGETESEGGRKAARLSQLMNRTRWPLARALGARVLTPAEGPTGDVARLLRLECTFPATAEPTLVARTEDRLRGIESEPARLAPSVLSHRRPTRIGDGEPVLSLQRAASQTEGANRSHSLAQTGGTGGGQTRLRARIESEGNNPGRPSARTEAEPPRPHTRRTEAEPTRSGAGASRPPESEPPPLTMVPFDENGLMTDGEGFDQWLDGNTTVPSDVFVMSHGWNNSASEAQNSYTRMIGLMNQMANTFGLRPTGFSPLIIGVRWPSKAWADGQRATESETGPGLDPAREGPVGRSIDPRLVAALYENFPRDRVSDRDYGRDIMKMQDLLTKPSPAPADFAAAFRLYRRYSLGARLPEDRGGFDSPRAEELAASGQPGQVEGEFSLLDTFRVFTYWQMKERAGIVGGNGVREMLTTLQRRFPQARFHLLGHSFGCKVMLSAVGDRDRSLPRAVETIVLLQPAISLESFATRVTGTRPPLSGGYRRVLDPSRVKGPVVLTFSKNDDALYRYYPLASRFAGQTGETEAEATKYSALGAFGAYGADVQDFGPSFSLAMIRPDNLGRYRPYPFARGVWSVNGSLPTDGSVPRDGNALIADHSLIYNSDVAWLLWQAILAGR